MRASTLPPPPSKDFLIVEAAVTLKQFYVRGCNMEMNFSAIKVGVVSVWGFIVLPIAL